MGIGFNQLLSSLCERELSQPISREAVTEGSAELIPPAFGHLPFSKGRSDLGLAELSRYA